MKSAWTIAALTLTRLLRGRAVWVSAIIAALPVAFASAIRARSTASRIDILVFVMLLFVILPAMFVSASVGEDIEDRTTTYLWSRPVPRWSILIGKLVLLAPLTACFITASWMAAVLVGKAELPSAQSCLALFAGGLVMSCIAAAIATLVPKHGMSLMIAYVLFFDGPVGVMPISLSNLSVTHHVRILTDIVPPAPNDPTTGGPVGLVILGALWLALALWRFRRLEA